MALVKMFAIIVAGGTMGLTLLILPVYFLRKRKNPEDQKNTIQRLIVLSFVAATVFTFLFGSGLTAMYIDDEQRKNGETSKLNEEVETSKSVNSVNIRSTEQPGESEMTYKQISMDEARKVFEYPGDYIILDVRRPEEFAEGHISGAVNVANETIEDLEPIELPDKDQTIYVYCRSGNRSKQAAEKLVKIGYSGIVECGGICDWTGEIEKE